MKALFLYSKSEVIAEPWAEAGYECHLFDLKLINGVSGRYHYHGGDIRQHRALIGDLIRSGEVVFTGGFPPCTDLAVSGARHFESKAVKDAYYLAKAMEHVHLCFDIGEMSGKPYFLENPRSVISTLLRKKDHSFNPCDYGGYLKSGEVNTYYPDIYPPKMLIIKKRGYGQEVDLRCRNLIEWNQ